ncbi:LAFE_0B00650g1_1 [Lachancea fermentati]|uniref:LAFE_0B00650g1_1 n=1 Tax=Lachancea fermentati TaxID=4955 RepID=A0A1G4M7C8_LACFM|nr:LAFE_0B00650g1_1 [Lachancea fermentati]
MILRIIREHRNPVIGVRYFCNSKHLLNDLDTVHIKNTNRFRQLLVDDGDFTSQQANALVNIMSSALKGGITHVSQDLASREKLIQLVYQQRVDFAKLRDQLLSADRSEFHSIQNEYEGIRNDLEKLRTKLREEITKANAGFKLDLSLEKGRIREESSHHDLQIKEIDTRIDQEVTNMKMQIDSVKTQVMQWLIGVCTGTFALVLAYVRLLS